MNFGRLEFVDGGVDEVRVLTRALTPIEVANLHNPATAAATPAADARGQMLEIAAEKDPAVIKARQELTDARLAEQRVETPIYQMMVTADAPKPRVNHILDHGQYDKYLEVVPTQALPKVFAWSDKLPKNRLGLTQWLFDPKNPMTARVYRQPAVARPLRRPASSRRSRTSAPRARTRPIRSCWTTWPSSSSARAGT